MRTGSIKSFELSSYCWTLVYLC